jgi:quercetin dioxygenase-like cupin family protein
MKTLFTILSFLAGLTLIAAAYANDDPNEDKKTDHTIIIAQASVTPEEEVRQAAEMDATGPRKTTGIKALRILGTVPLAGEFENPEEHVLRGREIDIEPGGRVAVHRHDGRPGLAYIVSGQLTEHRVGVDKPVVKKAGDAVWERTGTLHWWENEGDTVARVIVVDIVPSE